MLNRTEKKESQRGKIQKRKKEIKKINGMIVGKCWSTVGYRRLDENTNTWLRIEF